MRVLISILLLLLLTAAGCPVTDCFPAGYSHYIKNGTLYDMELTVVPNRGSMDTLGPFNFAMEETATAVTADDIEDNTWVWTLKIFSKYQGRSRSGGSPIVYFSSIFIRYSNGRCDTLNQMGTDANHPAFYNLIPEFRTGNEDLTNWEIYDSNPGSKRDCNKTIEYTYVFSEAFYNRSAPCNAVSGSGLSGSGVSGG